MFVVWHLSNPAWYILEDTVVSFLVEDAHLYPTYPIRTIPFHFSSFYSARKAALMVKDAICWRQAWKST